MKSKYIISLDLDGTTLLNIKEKNPKWPIPGDIENAKKRIHKDVKFAIDSLQKLGHYVVINTGRSWEMTQDIYEALNLNGPSINFAGGHIHWPNNNSFQSEHIKLNKVDLFELLNDPNIKNKIKGVLFENSYGGEIYIGNSEHMQIFFDQRNHNFNKIEIDNIDNLTFEPQSCFIDFEGDKVSTNIIKEWLRENYPNFLYSYWSSNFYELNGIEINSLKSNKGTSLSKLARLLGVDEKNTIAFGDGDNDIEMIKSAGVGVAMKNAEDFLKSIADEITEFDNDNGGVGKHLIYKFNLMEEENEN